jgi:hypothetical protein
MILKNAHEAQNTLWVFKPTIKIDLTCKNVR